MAKASKKKKKAKTITKKESKKKTTKKTKKTTKKKKKKAAKKKAPVKKKATHAPDPDWLAALVEGEFGAEHGVVWLRSDERFEQHDDAEPKLNVWCVARGPSFTSDAVDEVIEHQSFIWVGKSSTQLYLSLDRYTPADLWIPFQPTELDRVINEYFNPDRQPHDRERLWSEEMLMCVAAGIEYIENTFVMNPFCQAQPLALSEENDCSAVFKTSHSGTRIHVHGVPPIDFGDGAYPIVVSFHYAPVTPVPVVAQINDDLASAYPLDLPIDAVGATRNWSMHSAAGLDSDLDELTDWEEILECLSLYSCIADDEPLAKRLSQFSSHSRDEIRSCVIVCSYLANQPDILRALIPGEQNDDLKHQAERLVARLEAL